MESKTTARIKPFIDLLQQKNQIEEAFATLRGVESPNALELREIMQALERPQPVDTDLCPEVELVRLGIPIIYVDMGELRGQQLQSVVRQFAEHLRITTPLSRFPRYINDGRGFIPLDRYAPFAVRCRSKGGDTIGMARPQFVEVVQRTHYDAERATIANLKFVLFPDLNPASWTNIEVVADVRVHRPRQRQSYNDWNVTLTSEPFPTVMFE